MLTNRKFYIAGFIVLHRDLIGEGLFGDIAILFSAGEFFDGITLHGQSLIPS